MAAQPQRKRQQIRRKALVADTTTALDLSNVKPHLPLKARGAGTKLWKQFETETPFWWNAADIPTAATLCAVTDTLKQALDDDETSAAGKAALIKEWRSLAGELGLSPTSRGRLKLTEAQSSVAAKKVEALEAKQRKKRSGPIDVDDLLEDG